ncbi:hypothetical protein [Methylobacterium fujisawaense]
MPILCLDFDGVIHSYSSGWKGAAVIPDPPVPGALAFIEGAVHRFTVAIYSSRSGQPGGIHAMREYLRDAAMEYFAKTHGLGGSDRREAVDALMDDLSWPTEKPPALVTIDDRAIQFTGQWPSYRELLDFQPWNKRPAKAQSVLDAEAAEAQIAAWVAEVDELPDPRTTLMSVEGRRHLELLKRIADILR